MNPAQKALQDKLARMRAAKNDSGQPNNDSGQVEAEKQNPMAKVTQPAPELEKLPEATSVSPPAQVTETTEPAKQENVPERISAVAQTDHPIRMQLAELEAALNDKQPGFKTILRDIHTKLRQDPAIVTLLSDEEIGQILAGLKQHAQVEIIAPKEKKTASKEQKARVANMTADDL